MAPSSSETVVPKLWLVLASPVSEVVESQWLGRGTPGTEDWQPREAMAGGRRGSVRPPGGKRLIAGYATCAKGCSKDEPGASVSYPLGPSRAAGTLGMDQTSVMPPAAIISHRGSCSSM